MADFVKVNYPELMNFKKDFEKFYSEFESMKSKMQSIVNQSNAYWEGDSQKKFAMCHEEIKKPMANFTASLQEMTVRIENTKRIIEQDMAAGK